MRVYDDPLIDEAALFAIAAQLLAHLLIAVNARDQHGSPSLFPLINRASRAFARFEKLLAALVRVGPDLEAEDPYHQAETPYFDRHTT